MEQIATPGSIVRREHTRKLTEGYFDRELLPKAARRGRKPQERRWVLNAILSVVRTGCPWPALLKDFPKWKVVYTVFWRWRQQGVEISAVQNVRFSRFKVEDRKNVLG